MDDVKWSRLKQTLLEALSLPAAAREAFLGELERSDPSLRAELESLLAAHDAAGTTFLGSPLAQLAARSKAGALVGVRLGAYELTSLIGAGGMGEVYRAVRVDEAYRKEVAVKLVRAGAHSAFVTDRLRAERQILAGLEHPNIARLLDGGTTADGVPYLVMELVAGAPITTYCDEARLDTSGRLRLFLQVCDAVQHAHERMLVHRDLKPANILVTADGVPKLLDFGIAKLLAPGLLPADPETAMQVLTPHYASPEQLEGAPVAATCDVYSLGVILYELLTGVRPYGDAASFEEVRRSVTAAEPARPSTVVTRDGAGADHGAFCEGSAFKLRRRLRGDLDNVVLMALRREPQRRYPTVAQLAADIGRHLRHAPVRARRPTLAYRASRFLRRHRAGSAIGMLAVLALTVTGAMLWREHGIALAESRRAEAHRELAERRLKDVQKLAASLIFDIHDSIRNLPGASASRHLLISTALHYLEGLESEAHDNADLAAEMANAYMRLADIQGDMEASQDDYAGAAQSIKRAIVLWQAVIAAKPASPQARVRMAMAADELGDLLWQQGDAAGALATKRGNVETARALPADPAYAQVYWLVSMSYGYSLAVITGDVETAKSYALPAVSGLDALWQAGLARPDPALARSLAVVYYRTCQILAQGHELEAAVAMARHALEVLAVIRGVAPFTPVFQIQEAAASHFGAAALIQLGRFEEARTHDLRALAIVQQLAADDPRIAEYKGFMGMGRTGLAEIAWRQGQSARAQGLLTQALADFGVALAAGTAHLDIRREHAQAELLAAQIHAALGADPSRSAAVRARDLAAACDGYQRAQRALKGLEGVWFEAREQAAQAQREAGQCSAAAAPAT